MAGKNKQTESLGLNNEIVHHKIRNLERKDIPVGGYLSFNAHTFFKSLESLSKTVTFQTDLKNFKMEGSDNGQDVMEFYNFQKYNKGIDTNFTFGMHLNDKKCDRFRKMLLLESEFYQPSPHLESERFKIKHIMMTKPKGYDAKHILISFSKAFTIVYLTSDESSVYSSYTIEPLT